MDNPAAASRESKTQSQTPRNSNEFNQVESSDVQSTRSAVFKGPKRKRLVKACDPCHKSKRRCDGTAPCSNCYFACKECTYTDSSGRPVPAPNALRPDVILSQPSTLAHGPANINLSVSTAVSGSYQTPEVAHPHLGLLQSGTLPDSTSAPGPSSSINNLPAESSAHSPLSEAPYHRGGHRVGVPRDYLPPRKRLKNDLGSPNRHIEPSDCPLGTSLMNRRADPDRVDSGAGTYQRMDGTVASSGFSRHVIHELVNLFFAHCHPHRLIIHSTSFYADLCRGRIPPYLLNAVCAVAAPLSQNPLVREIPVRQSGRKFANAALAELFDAEGHLMETGVEAAQALALVQTYLVYKESSFPSDLRLYDLALRILHSLHTLDKSSGATDTASFSPDELYSRTIQRECAQRTFWLIHMVELLGAVFTRRPTMYSKDELGGVRLPCDEESFDLALQAPPDRVEYLDSPAVKSSDTSEFGHVIRIATILLDIESNNVDSPDPQGILNCEQQLEQWVISLADHLRYNPDNLRAHLSLWETGSNTSTWCYCFMHVLHACAVLALSSVRMRLGKPVCHDHESALQAIPEILKALGPRARNSILMGSVLWVQYCGPHASKYNLPGAELRDSNTGNSNVLSQGANPQLQFWIREWEEFWGPATGQRVSNISDASSEGRQLAFQQAHPIGATRSDTGASNLSMSGTSARTVPDLVINPVVHSDETDSSSARRVSPTMSNSSISRTRNQPFLPSLKSSGLLDVLPDESLGSRSSGASTPVKTHPLWELSSSGSPRPLLLSPGLHTSGASGSSGSAPVSPQPHSPSVQVLHTPLVRLQAPSFYHANSAQPNPVIVTSPATYEESETHDSRVKL